MFYFVYHGIGTVSDPVFGIDFSPYYVAGQLLAENRPDELIPLPAEGLILETAVGVAKIG